MKKAKDPITGQQEIQQPSEKTYGPQVQFKRMHKKLWKRALLIKDNVDDEEPLGIPKEFKKELDQINRGDGIQDLMNISSNQFITMKNT